MLANVFISVINLTINALAVALSLALNLSIPSPFQKIVLPEGINYYLSYINYFIPISTLLSITSFWLIAVGVYYAQMVILRWAKAVS